MTQVEYGEFTSDTAATLIGKAEAAQRQAVRALHFGTEQEDRRATAFALIAANYLTAAKIADDAGRDRLAAIRGTND